jgi:hypothetical protein
MFARFVRISAALACVAALLPLRPAAAADDASELLAKHQAYVGWHEGDGVVKTLRETGTAAGSDGKTVATLTQLRYGVAQRRTVVSDNGTSARGFTGTIYWSTGTNGFTLRPVGEVIKALFDQDALFGELTVLMTPTVLRHEQVDGVDTVVLRLTSPLGFPMDVYEDPTTGAYKRAVVDPDGKYELFYNGLGYTEQSGKRFLTTYHIGSNKTINTYTSIEINPTLSPDELRPPKQTATWTFGEGTSPVEYVEESPNEVFPSGEPRILIDVVVNGVKGKFVLDTGAGVTAITEGFAKRINAKRITSTELSGIGGSTAASVYQVDTIAVGPSVLHNVYISSGLHDDFDPGVGVVGLIGYDLLAGAIVDLNLDAGTLRIMDPAKVEPDQSKGIVVHADFSDQHIKVPMKLNGKFNVIATLDTGNPINVLFSKDLVQHEGLLFLVDPEQIGSSRYGGGVGGVEIEHCGRLGALDLGPISYKPVPACDSEFETRNEILVGLDFMKNFNYVFDYPDGIMVMTPRK